MYISNRKLASLSSSASFAAPAAISAKTLSSIDPLKAQKLKLFALSRRIKRHGAAAVEFAVVAPLLFFLLLGLIEFGRLMMVQQIMTNASREGARKSVLANAQWEGAGGVSETVQNYMNSAGIDTGDYSCPMPSNFTSANAGDSIEIQVSVLYGKVSWMQRMTGQIFGTDFSFGDVHDVTLRARCTMRKEANNN